MNHFKIFLLTLVLTTGLVACSNDPTNEENTENKSAVAGSDATNKPVKSLTEPEGTVKYLVRNELLLDDRTEIKLPGKENTDTVTIFLLRPAETMEEKSSLTREGQMRAGQLATVMSNTGIAQIYAEGNSAMQTAIMTSRGNGSELGIFEFDGSDQLLKTILQNFKNKKVMIIANPQTITAIMDQLAGPGKYALASDEYDNLFVAFAAQPGTAAIHHLKY